jgi:RNA polymerase sigma-70 factor (ECF subfamily)
VADFHEFNQATRHRRSPLLHAMSGDRAEAQDAAQEAYVRA